MVDKAQRMSRSATLLQEYLWPLRLGLRLLADYAEEPPILANTASQFLVQPRDERIEVFERCFMPCAISIHVLQGE